MTEVSPFAEFLGQVIYQFTAVKPLLPTYGHLLVSVLFPIYIGAHASLSRPSSAAEPPRKTQEADGEESDDEDEDDEDQGDDRKMEGLAPSDALIFPLTAGCTLGGLYLVMKWMGADKLNKILGFYFSQMGIFFAVAFLKDTLTVLRSFVFPRKYSKGGKLWKVKQSDRVFAVAQEGSTTTESLEARNSPLPGVFGSIPLPGFVVNVLWTSRNLTYQRAKLRVHLHRILKFECSAGLLDLASISLALPAVAYFTFIMKPWWLTNFLGFSFCYGTLQFMSPSSFVTGSLILSSLFFYDIYFVYFTPLMVTVAKGLDVPIKLVFPRPAGPGAPPDAISLAMIGLGDIIIPGMMIGLALRFDLFLYYKRKGMHRSPAKDNTQEAVKPLYQTATGGWGERFWVSSVSPNQPEMEPPYYDARSFPKTYFKTAMVGYIIGTLVTLIIMQCFDHPQPALLYLVPGVLISLWGTALVKGDLEEMWEFSDAEEEEEDTEEVKEEKQQDDTPVTKVGFFGRILAGNVKATKKGGKSENTKVEKKSMAETKKAQGNESKKTAKGGNSKNMDLFSISLYIPKKSRPKTSDQPVSPTNDAKSTVDDENWSFVGKTERDNEPPAKRRRRSPRNAAATTSSPTK
ncbi:signal peptide peptidase-domain-containing protein [Aspergillus leporis]|jgi:minor histocompatibility antigen H13|uniref:Signal peptide peptidase-domain-containing protein n=1 Tax=Aspergillus leporis TaxID=41062 RepID=A0A5N5WZL1_9EURO|nr:signal peptide peptidase-domain-containing protein [Aspergillus leporis]